MYSISLPCSILTSQTRYQRAARRVADENTSALLSKKASSRLPASSNARPKVFGTSVANSTGLTAGPRRKVLGTVTNTSSFTTTRSGKNAISQGLEKPPQRVSAQNNNNNSDLHSFTIPTTARTRQKSNSKHVYASNNTSSEDTDSDSQSTKTSAQSKRSQSEYLKASQSTAHYSDDTEFETEDGEEDEDEEIEYEEPFKYISRSEIRQARGDISPSSTVDADDDDFEISEDDLVQSDDHAMVISPVKEFPKYRVTVDCRSSCNPEAVCPVWDLAANEELFRLQEEFKNMPGIFDEDDEDTYDISMAAEYSDDIFEYMRELEVRYRPDAGYMERQGEINWYKRGILMDWLVRIHDHCNLLPETLFLTCNYIDRFLSLKTVVQAKLQLVGIVALYVAAKYEEITCPSVQEIAYMVENEYTVEEILRVERYMINLFEFNMGWPGPMSFLRRSSKADDYDSDTRTLAKYLLEITIMDERFVGAPPSWLAAASHYLSRHILSRGSWSKAHTYFSGYTEAQLKPAVNIMISCCKTATTHHRSIYRKYSDARFKWVALHVTEWVSSNLS